MQAIRISDWWAPLTRPYDTSHLSKVGWYGETTKPSWWLTLRRFIRGFPPHPYFGIVEPDVVSFEDTDITLCFCLLYGAAFTTSRAAYSLSLSSLILLNATLQATGELALHSLSAMSQYHAATEGTTIVNEGTEAQNPFDDPAGSEVMDNTNADAVLNVDRNATLSLGTDSLIVLDEGLRERRDAADCCGMLRTKSKSTRPIPFHNVLWAELKELEVMIHYAHVGKGSCRVQCIRYAITDKTVLAHAQSWVERLLVKAYPAGCKRNKRLKVLINPFGGQGRAAKIWTHEAEPLFAAAKCDADVEKTGYRGHAAEIAEKLDIDAYDAVLCASGDGTPHEVFNGLARRPDGRKALRKLAVSQIPCGSGNALSLNFNGTQDPSMAALAIIKGTRTPVDLVAITQGDKQYYSFLSQAVGIIAETDLGTESLRWMGAIRFTWGLLVRLIGKTVYPADLAVAVETSDKMVIRDSYRRAREEAERLNSMQPNGEAEALLTPHEGLDAIPSLRYGTVNDPMPPSFVSEDQSTLGNFYAGNMCWMSPDAPFFPTALPNDGRMDLVTIDGHTSRIESIKMVSGVGSGAIMNFDVVGYRKITGYRIDPHPPDPLQKPGFRDKVVQRLGGSGDDSAEGYIAIDGERVPFEAYQAEVLPGLATVLCKTKGLYEHPGPKSP